MCILRNSKKRFAQQKDFLVHTSDEVINLIFAITKVTTLDEVVDNFTVSTSWSRQFEWPEEVVCLIG